MYRTTVRLAVVTLLICLGGCAKIGLEKEDLAWLKPDLKIGEADVFSFAVIGDMNLSDARGTALLSRAVADINKREDVVFVVAAGNIAANGQYKEFNLAKNAFLELEATYYAVPGLSDVDPSKRAPYENFERVFGEIPWLQQRNGWAIIGMSAVGGEGAASVPAEHLDWLATQLKRFSKDRPIALFLYYSLESGVANRVQNADDLLALFEGRPLRLVISGGSNSGTIAEGGETSFLGTGPLAATGGNGRGYRLYHVDKATITEEWVSLSE
jgi:hypothetical protein